jgi:hypothetical protein
MPEPATDVELFMAGLTHPMKAAVERLRAAILAADPGITEHVKWNAPSFRYAGEDRVTFQLRRADRIQLVFHRGAKVRADSAGFAFEDPTGLMQWATSDRAVVTLTDPAQVETQAPAITSLAARWVRV